LENRIVGLKLNYYSKDLLYDRMIFKNLKKLKLSYVTYSQECKLATLDKLSLLDCKISATLPCSKMPIAFKGKIDIVYVRSKKACFENCTVTGENNVIECVSFDGDVSISDDALFTSVHTLDTKNRVPNVFPSLVYARAKRPSHVPHCLFIECKKAMSGYARQEDGILKKSTDFVRFNFPKELVSHIASYMVYKHCWFIADRHDLHTIHKLDRVFYNRNVQILSTKVSIDTTRLPLIRELRILARVECKLSKSLRVLEIDWCVNWKEVVTEIPHMKNLKRLIVGFEQPSYLPMAYSSPE